jgi:anti-sigma B factor antagonist
MSANTSSDGPDGGSLPFACDWGPEGIEAASVRVSGELDLATAPRLEQTLREALARARLVVLNMREVSFMDSTGLHVILNASGQAQEMGARLVIVGQSARIDALLELTGTRDLVEVLPVATATERFEEDGMRLPHDSVAGGRRDWSNADELEHRIRPLDNPVNASVLTARVMAIPDRGVWFRGADGAVRRAWAPSATGFPVPAGTSIEVYLDARGKVNGWREPSSGLAINQRRLDPDASSAPAAAVACQGACGLVWRAPAAARLVEHDERGLTCAGALVPD